MILTRVLFSVSGCTDYFAGTEEEAFEISRDAIAAFNIDLPCIPEDYDEPAFDIDDLKGIIPGQDQHTMDMYKVLYGYPMIIFFI